MPLAFGYRLSWLCLGCPERLGRPWKGSDLSVAGQQLRVPEQEDAVRKATNADFRQQAPLDILVKTLPCLPVAYWAIATVRLHMGFAPGPAYAIRIAAWLATCAAGALIARRLMRWLRRRGSQRWCRTIVLVGIGAVTVTIGVRMHGIPGLSGLSTGRVFLNRDALAWAVVVGLVAERVWWLVRALSERHHTLWWSAVPVLMTCAIASVAPVPDWDAEDRAYYRNAALADAGLTDLPTVTRTTSRAVLLRTRDFTGSDFRAQDLHGLSLKRMTVAGA
jgi:hypothetical protein